MIKLPNQLYVTGQDRGVDPQTGPNPPLGFLNAYEPGKSAFESKRITQEKWAYFDYCGIQDAKIEMDGPDAYCVGWKWEFDRNIPYNQPGSSFKVPVRDKLKVPPVIWDNTPLPGFKILTSVSRFSTSNKLWRILDPRQYEFEITTGVLEQLIMDATILKGGIIDANCAWKANKNLVAVS